jgi:hypothetical protein
VAFPLGDPADLVGGSLILSQGSGKPVNPGGVRAAMRRVPGALNLRQERNRKSDLGKTIAKTKTCEAASGLQASGVCATPPQKRARKGGGGRFLYCVCSLVR